VSDATYEAIAEWSQIVAAILFVIALVVIWNKYLAPAVLASQARKNAELAEAEQRRDAARAEVEKAQAESAAADSDVRAISARAQGDAARLHEKILADARSEGEHAMLGAQGELERARTAAREKLRFDLIERAMEIARNAAVRLDDGTNDRLVGDTVDTAERGGHA
jgi:F0F1-type ATP synthase membrane subunit b/b'